MEGNCMRREGRLGEGSGREGRGVEERRGGKWRI